MKFTLSMLAVLAVASPLTALKLPSVGSGELAKELQDFIDPVPIDRIVEIVKVYLAQDTEVQKAMKLIHSKEMKLFMADVEAAPELKKVLDHMQNAGLDAYLLLNKLNESLDMPSASSLERFEHIRGGLKGLFDDITDIYPTQMMAHLLEYKIHQSKVFSDYVNVATAPEFVQFYTNLMYNPHFVKLILQGELVGLDKNVFENSIYGLVVFNALTMFG